MDANNVALNGSRRDILGPDGQPLRQSGLGLPGQVLPHPLTFIGLVNSVSRTYSWRWDEAYSKSRENALAMFRDCALHGPVRERIHAIKRMPWHIEGDDAKDPEQQQEADLLTRLVKCIPRLRRLVASCMWAIWWGRSGVQLGYDWYDSPYGRAFLPRNHQHLNGDKIQYGWDGVPRVLVYSGAAGYLRQQDPNVRLTVTDRGTALILDDPFWRSRFIIHQHDCIDADFYEYFEAGGVHGLGIRHFVYWYWWLKSEITTWLMDYMERTGLGLTIYYYEEGNAASEAHARKASKEDGRNTCIVWPRRLDQKESASGVERIETPTSGVGFIKEMMGYFDDKIERFIIQQTLSSDHKGSGGLGGSGAADFQMDTKYNVIEDDCDNVSETLTLDLVQVVQRFNMPQSRHSYRWVFDVPRPDRKGKQEGAKSLFEMKIPFKADEAREAAGFSKPGPDDEVVVSQQQGPEGAAAAGGQGGPEEEDDPFDLFREEEAVAYERAAALVPMARELLSCREE